MIWAALFSWPVFAAIFLRVWSVPVAVSATLIGGYLLLPTMHDIDFPLLPPLDKHTIPALSAVVLVWVASGDPRRQTTMLPGVLPRNGLVLVMIALIFVGAFSTVLVNREPLFYGPRVVPGMRLYDSFSILLGVVCMLVPFFIGRKILSTPDGMKSFVKVFVVAAVLYAFLALWEVRMSPQLNYQIYGFFPHSWIQHIRGGGFRPLVFLEHGLWLGIFFASAIIMAFGMWRYGARYERTRYFLAGGWLLGTLLLSKVLSSTVIVLALLPVLLFSPRRIQVIVAAGVSIVVLSYPVLRNADVIPTDAIVSFAESIDSQRAQSLQFRFDNEDALLAHAKQKPLFGWGGYGRNFVFDEFGNNTSISDGLWVVYFGKGGWFSYIGHYGLMTCGILVLCFRRSRDLDPVTVVVVLALTANMFDLLPNAGISPVTWMMAGILAGQLEKRAQSSEADVSAQPRPERPPAYARDFGMQNFHTRHRHHVTATPDAGDGSIDKSRGAVK